MQWFLCWCIIIWTFSFFLSARWRMCCELWQARVVYFKRREIYLFIYVDGGPSHWNEEPLLVMLRTSSLVKFICWSKMAEPQIFTTCVWYWNQPAVQKNWLCLHHCRNISVTTRLEPCWSARPRLSLFSQMDLTISLKVYFGAGQTHFWMTHIIVWVCQFCRYQWNFCYSLFDSSLPLFARQVAMRDAQMVLELQGERCPE